MAQYMITYLGGNPPSSPEEGQQHMAKYRQWITSLGAAAVSPANPLKGTTLVNSDGSLSPGSSTGMSGFTTIEANSMEDALAIAQACPFLETGGSLEVSELVQMSI